MWAWDHGRFNALVQACSLQGSTLRSTLHSWPHAVWARSLQGRILTELQNLFTSSLIRDARFVRGGFKFYWWSGLGICTWRPFVIIQRLVRILMAHNWSSHLRLCLLKAPLIFFSFLIKPACVAGKMHASKETPCSSTVTIEIAQVSNCKLHFQRNCNRSLHSDVNCRMLLRISQNVSIIYIYLPDVWNLHQCPDTHFFATSKQHLMLKVKIVSNGADQISLIIFIHHVLQHTSPNTCSNSRSVRMKIHRNISARSR